MCCLQYDLKINLNFTVFFYPFLGTNEERGILKWRETTEVDRMKASQTELSHRVYDIPLVQKLFSRWRWTGFVPFCPTFQGFCGCFGRCKTQVSNEVEDSNDLGINGIERSGSIEQVTKF